MLSSEAIHINREGTVHTNLPNRRRCGANPPLLTSRLSIVVTVCCALGALPTAALMPHALAETNTSAQLLVGQAAELAKHDQLDQSLEKYSQAIESDQTLAAAWAGRAGVRERLGKHHTALQDYSKAIALDPKNANYYAGRAFCNLALGADTAALKDAEEALKIDPRNNLARTAKSKARHGSHSDGPASLQGTNAPVSGARTAATRAFAEGQNFELNGNLIDAMRKYSEAITLDPTLPYPYATRGRARLDLRDLTGARADYDKAISLTPDNPDLYASRALIDREEGNLDDAIANMNIALRLSPNESNYYLQRAVMYVAQKDYASGRNDVAKALELNPGNDLALTLKKRLEEK